MIEARSMIVIALLLGIALSVTNHFARPEIELKKQQFLMRQLEEIVGTEHTFDFVTPTHYTLLKDNLAVGRIEQVSTTEGYNGEITFWLATKIDQSERRVLGVRVIEHEETPGLGDKLDLAVSDWILSFNHQSLSSADWEVKKFGGDFDQFSGATITPRAVVRSIHARLMELELEAREVPQ